MQICVYCCSVTKLYLTLQHPWTEARQASPSFIISPSLLKLMFIESVMPYDHLILCYLLFLSPSIFPSIRVFPKELALCIRWPKYWSFSFSICPSNEHSGLISFRMDWLISLQSKGHSESSQASWSKESFIPFSAFFMIQLSHQYMTIGKTMYVCTIWTNLCPKKYNKCLSLEQKEPKFMKFILWFHQALTKRGTMEGGTSSSCNILRSSGPSVSSWAPFVLLRCPVFC